jgi:hypothetical protein
MKTSATASTLRQELLVLMLFLIQFNNANACCGLPSFETAQSGRWVPAFKTNKTSNPIINNNCITAITLCR